MLLDKVTDALFQNMKDGGVPPWTPLRGRTSPSASSVAQRDLDGACATSQQSSRVDTFSTQASLGGSQTNCLLTRLATPFSAVPAPPV
eukprot:6824670-Karenia_brevis.AAC.1